MTPIVSVKPEPARIQGFRISDSESTVYKLMYQVRTGNLNGAALDRLQTQSTNELHQLRSELDLLLQELREFARSEDRQTGESIAA